jgi:DNA-binding CsgD family transcriptional regulator
VAARRRNEKVWLADVQGRLDCLTARERDVMEGMVAGRLNKQIADDLGISMKTVEQHRSRVMEKLRVDSSPSLCAWSSWPGISPTEGPFCIRVFPGKGRKGRICAVQHSWHHSSMALRQTSSSPQRPLGRQTKAQGKGRGDTFNYVMPVTE